MIVDGRDLAVGSIRNADICVIGAGPAGLFLAERLARLSKCEIAVLESGDLAFDPRIQELAHGEVEGQRYFPLKETRIRRFGGTSWSWGGFLTPLDPIDHEPRPWVPDSGWPISQAELARYIEDALEGCGLTRPAPHVEDGSTPVVTRPLHYRGPIRFARDFSRRLRRAERLTIYLRSTVSELVARQSGDAVSEALVISTEGAAWTLSARVFVLATGGIDNARLLLASNRVHPSGLGNSHDLVGRYFMEHPRIRDHVYLPREGRQRAELPARAAERIHVSRIGIGEGVQREESLLNCGANVSFGFAGQDDPSWESLRRVALAARRPWNESPYFQLAGGGPMGFRADDFRAALHAPVTTLMAGVGGALRPRSLRRFVSIETSIEQPPKRDNRVVLDSERDRLGMPLPRLQWTLDEAVRRTYDRSFALFLRHLEERIPGLSEQRVVRGVWPDEVQGTWHHMGTTRMHPDPARGVVDLNCRIHEMANLYVAGSSVFPTGGAAAPTLTIIALALRLADHLARTHEGAAMLSSDG